MDLAALRIVKAVVDEGGVTRAAERLGRVQSNVTTRIRQLEADLGVDLFIREGKRLHPSPAGRILYDYAGRLLDLAAEARAAVQDNRPRGRFRLGAMESTAAVRLPEPLSRYHQRFPEVTLELRTGYPEALAREVLTGTLDAALVAGPVAAESFEARLAFREELVVIAAAGRDPVTADSLRRDPGTILAFAAGCPHRARLEDWYRSLGILPARIIEMTSYHAILGCVVAGMGVALVPRCVLTGFPELARLSVHALPSGRDSIDIQLIWRKGAPAPKVEALIAVLDELPAAA